MLQRIRVCVAKPRDLAVGFFVFSLMLCVIRPAIGQSNAATLNGTVTDSSGKVIPQAAITLENTATGTARTGMTNGSGEFTMPALDPGSYALRVEKQGFAQSEVKDLTLHTADTLAVAVTLKVGAVNTEVDVNGTSLTNDNPAVSMTVTREFIEDMPLNGRSFQDLIQLAPGTVSSSGYYSVDGQRTDSSNYTVDGVSANLGGVVNTGGSYATQGTYMAGAVPAQTALGTTQSLAALDSLQEFTIQTSGYTAEYGRSPGGQVQFTTRSGTNNLHGSAFEYLRNTALDANSYNNDYDHIAKTAEHQNDFGGTVGGPLIIPKFYNGHGKSFYFLSYEGLRLLLPENESKYVPTQAFRNAASPYIQPFLNAAPLPSGADNSDGCTVNGIKGGPACDALFNYAYSYPSNIDNYSARIDQSFGSRFHAFARYADTPSYVQSGAEQIITSRVNVHSWTAGLATVISSHLLDDLRFNYSRDGEQSVESMRPVGGSVPFAKSLLVPSAYDGPNVLAYADISLAGTSLSASYGYVGNGASTQHQYQIIDNLSWTRGKHSIKFGVDWRRLTPQYAYRSYSIEPEITSLADIQNGYATSLLVSAYAPGQPVFDNLSLYVQDHWKINPKLTVDYGLRWDFNPPPGPSNGFYPVTLTSTNLATATLTNDGTQPYKTNYHSFGPRFGFAWNAIPSQSHPVTVRGGAGIFFDTAQQAIGAAYAGAYPFKATRPTQSPVPFPFTGAVQAPPSLTSPLIPPYPSINELSSPDLTAPYTEQWNLAVDYSLNRTNTLTASYVGNNGRKLLFTQYHTEVPGNADFTSLNFTYNGAQSSYDALQIQDVGRLARGLNIVGSFTWAHALDNLSTDASSFLPIYGNSSNDLRRMLNLALNYQTVAMGPNRWTRELTRGWTFANRFSAQSGYPLNVLQATVVLADGTEVQYSPNLVPGVPIYLHGSAADVNGSPVPGNWRLNRAAFACTTSGATSGACPGTPTRQGTLGRNYIREPSFWAFNTALQRNISPFERMALNFRVEAFNLLNHPNLTEIQDSVSASNFGVNMGGIGTIGAYQSPLYAMGTARSLQLSLRAVF